MGKYKEALPKDTCNKILAICKEMNMEIKITEIANDNSTYSCVVVGYYNGKKIGSSNGKGMDRDYALASGLAEFIERLSNDYLIVNTNLYCDKKNTDLLKSKAGFNVHHDENYLLAEEIQKQLLFKQLFSTYGCFILHPWYEAELKKEQKVCCLPFKNIETEQESYAPYFNFGITGFRGSNGMVAGNSIPEALNEGISELIERQAMSGILTKDSNCKIKNIKRNCLDDYPKFKEIVYKLEKMDYKVFIKDISVGHGYPVIGLFLINQKTGNIYSNFGCFPVFHIALERCFTEIFQNTNFEKIEERFHNVFPIEICETFYKENQRWAFKVGCCVFNDEFLYGTDEIDYKELTHFIFDPEEKKSNIEILDYWKVFAKKNNLNIWYHDASYYGFPACNIIIPELFEQIEFLNKDDIQNLFFNVTYKDVLFRFQDKIMKNDWKNYEEIYGITQTLISYGNLIILWNLIYWESPNSLSNAEDHSILMFITFISAYLMDDFNGANKAIEEIKAFYINKEFNKYFQILKFISNNREEKLYSLEKEKILVKSLYNLTNKELEFIYDKHKLTDYFCDTTKIMNFDVSERLKFISECQKYEKRRLEND